MLMFLMAFAILAEAQTFRSPNKKIQLSIDTNSAKTTQLKIDYVGKDKQRQHVLDVSSLGITQQGVNPSPEQAWRFSKLLKRRSVKEDYTMLTGKRSHCTNRANEYDCLFTTAEGKDARIILRLYNDGVALRYLLPNELASKMGDELTTISIPDGTPRWMQEYDMGYERFYPRTTAFDTSHNHFGFPALFQHGEQLWSLMTEADIQHGQAASALRTTQTASGTDYRVAPFLKEGESFGEASPWRIIAIGSLADIVETTLVTDVCPPSTLSSTDWIEPGCVSWVYWAYNRGSKDYQIVKRYIDMAATLHLPYVLIDWEWDVMTNGGTIDDALRYAKERNVKVLLWYNSSTAWTTNGAGGPLYRLNAPENREKEFAWLESLGVAGVKIDFFSGDTRETMDYCIDLLESAAKHHLLVNFHGATIPRGWQRTYPNFMSAEAVYGAEWYNNAPILTRRAAAHNATLPFTRNVIGPMDYTPCTFSDSQHPHITSHAHELALTVLFESGLQHLADRPESYLAQPEAVQQFFTQLPSAWDDTRLLLGNPGEKVVIQRQKGKRYYIAGINGLDEAQTIPLSFSQLPRGQYRMQFFTDSGNAQQPWAITEETINTSDPTPHIHCQPRGGFVGVLEKIR